MPTFNTPEPISAVLGKSPQDASGSPPPTGPTPSVEVLPADASRSPRREGGGGGRGRVRRRRPADRRPRRRRTSILGPSGAVAGDRAAAGGLPRSRRRRPRAELRGVGRLGDVVRGGRRRARSCSTERRERPPHHCQSGDVSVGRLGGPAEISTRKGDLRIAEAVGGTVTLRTESGEYSRSAPPEEFSASLDAGNLLRPDPQRAQEHGRRRRRPDHRRDHRLRQLMHDFWATVYQSIDD